MFHLYAIGKTGTGKSTLIESLAVQDIAAGQGLAVIDPHGDMVERLRDAVPAGRLGDVVYVNVADPALRFGYNPLRKVALPYVPLAVSGLLEAFKKRWPDAWGSRMEHMLRNALYALIEHGGATLPDVLRILTDDDYRKGIVKALKNPQVKEFWLSEFPGYNPRYRQESISPIQSKIGALLSDPRLYRFLTAPDVDLRFRRLMDEGKIVLINLAKGKLGEDSSSLLGSLLVTTLSLAAFSRADAPAAARRDFFIYVDEFQCFTTQTVGNMVSELRKYRVGLILANQHLVQLDDEIRASVLGNVGTLISFRLGQEDARTIAREFEPTFAPEDIMNLPNHAIYIKLMIAGAPGQAFSARTLPPDTLPTHL